MYSSFCTIEQKILCICKCEYEYFFKMPNVIGVGLGYKIKNGFYTNEKCIVVFVSQKIPYCKLSNQEMIPLNYKGITTDVIESGRISSAGLTKRIRPAQGGYSISNISKNSRTGTMGCLVYNGHLKYLLSNNHIIADENKADIGSPIIQPGVGDGGKESKDVVAHLSRFMPLHFASPKSVLDNYSDCAIAQLVNPSIATSKIAYVGKPKGVVSAKLKESVQKIGRTTGKTTGTVRTIGATMTIDYLSGTCVFRNQILTTNMGKDGDSGAVLLDKNAYALGILCGNTDSLTMFSPMDTTLKLLSVQLVTD